MQRTNIYLAAQQTEALDRLATGRGVSRAEVIRQLLDRGLAGIDDDPASDLAAIDGSFGSAPDLETPDRSAGARERWLSDLWGDE
ncbi:MAG: CopG family transcriptional regulator [Propionicimonas sp.]|uniref:ribbon-helix-helix domain-containing protein n=1 Tax=Propionicimonas sp. TaxID=1955623 RepID=UPI003D0A2950